jgi:hypothetical protein
MKLSSPLSNLSLGLLCVCLLPTIVAYEHPYDIPWFQPVLSECRLQCPDTSGAQVTEGEFEGVTIEDHFYVINESTMVLGMQQSLGSRCELRHNPMWSTSEVTEEKKLKAFIKIEPHNVDGFSFAQIKGKSYQGFKSGPLLMMQWQAERSQLTDHLWVNIRQNLDAATKINTNYDLGPRPTGFFHIEISVYNHILKVWVGGELKVEQNIDYWAQIDRNYFKTGPYLSSQSFGPQTIQYKELSIVTSGSPTSTPAPTVAPTLPPTNFPTRSPTAAPTVAPTLPPTDFPTRSPTAAPTASPTPLATLVVGLSEDSDRNTFVPIDEEVVDGDAYISIHTTPAMEDIIDLVSFSIDGTVVKVERKAPFDLGGTGSGLVPNSYDTSSLSPGSHTLTTAVEFTTGGTTTLVDTFVVAGEDVFEGDRVVQLVLVNSVTNLDMRVLSDGEVIDGSTPFSVRADTNPTLVGSVLFRVNGSLEKKESFAPYAIAGDKPTGNYNAWMAGTETFEITATPYSERSGKGTAGQALTISVMVN